MKNFTRPLALALLLLLAAANALARGLPAEPRCNPAEFPFDAGRLREFIGEDGNNQAEFPGHQQLLARCTYSTGDFGRELTVSCGGNYSNNGLIEAYHQFISGQARYFIMGVCVTDAAKKPYWKIKKESIFQKHRLDLFYSYNPTPPKFSAETVAYYRTGAQYTHQIDAESPKGPSDHDATKRHTVKIVVRPLGANQHEPDPRRAKQIFQAAVSVNNRNFVVKTMSHGQRQLPMNYGLLPFYIDAPRWQLALSLGVAPYGAEQLFQHIFDREKIPALTQADSHYVGTYFMDEFFPSWREDTEITSDDNGKCYKVSRAGTKVEYPHNNNGIVGDPYHLTSEDLAASGLRKCVN